MDSCKQMKRALALWGLAVVAACSSDDGQGARGPTPRFHLGEEAFPTFLDVPFPSDAYLENGHVSASLPEVERVFPLASEFITHELARLDGFSRLAPALFWIDDPTGERNEAGELASAELDPASLPESEKACLEDASSVFMLDLEAPDPASARVPCRAMWHHDHQSLSDARPVLAVGPARGVVLEEGHRYAAIVTSRVKDDAGRTLEVPSELTNIDASPSNVGKLYADALGKARSLLEASLAADGAKIVAIAPYTTHTRAREMEALRTQIDARPKPSLSWDPAAVAPMTPARFAAASVNPLPAGFTATLDAWLGQVDPAAKLPDGHDDPDDNLPVRAHDAILAVGTGVFESTNFLVDKGDYALLDHATFERDPNGAPIVSTTKPTSKVWVSLAIPTAPMPPSGYPVIVLQHGLGSSRHWIMTLANVLCAKGWAVAAIEAVTFGARARDPRYQNDKTTDYQGGPGVTYNGPDGIADKDDTGARNGSFDFFGGLKNVGALRDQLRQSAVDIAELVRMLDNAPDLSPLSTGATAPKLDMSKLAYVGDSLGAIEGALASTLEPRLSTVVLNVLGGGLLLEVATNSPTMSLMVSAAAGLNFGIRGGIYDEGSPFIALGQTLLEPGDPLVYAPWLVRSPLASGPLASGPRNLLQFEVLFDELLPNEANEAFARAAGMGLALPNVGSNAGITDLKNPDGAVRRVPLPDIAPDAAGDITNTPEAGHTAVVVQLGPSVHGSNIVESYHVRNFEAPFARSDTSKPYVNIPEDRQFRVSTTYRSVQATFTTFIQDAMDGRVPRVRGLDAPRRDFDDDGSPDATDPNSNDPNVR